MITTDFHHSLNNMDQVFTISIGNLSIQFRNRLAILFRYKKEFFSRTSYADYGFTDVKVLNATDFRIALESAYNQAIMDEAGIVIDEEINGIQNIV